MPMRRADRRSESDDNVIRNLRSRQLEPVSTKDLKQRLMTVQSQRDESQQLAQDFKRQVEQNYALYEEEQQKGQTTLALYEEEQHKHQTTLTLYQQDKQVYETTLTLYQEKQQAALTKYEEAQQQAQSYLDLYNQETARSGELLITLETVQGERDRYITLYTEAQSDLKFERRSKAGIKGWETRRKRENERLRKEIGEMTVLLRDSLERKETAIGNLEELAGRMDRIQSLVDSVEEGDDTPIGLLQKFQRIWQTVRDILAE